MENQIRAGDTCTITREISVGGKHAFQSGEWVRVERIEPDPQRPEHRYVVRSQFLQSWLKLTDADLAVRSNAQPAPPTQGVAPPPPMDAPGVAPPPPMNVPGAVPPPPMDAPGAAFPPPMDAPGAAFPPPIGAPGAGRVGPPGGGGFRSSSAFLPVVIIIAIVIAVAAFVAVYFITSGGEEVTVEVGWTTFEGGGVQISLPDNYEGGSADELDELISAMNSLGPEYSEMAEMAAANPDLFLLWAYDPDLNTDGFMTNVIVLAEPIPSGITLDTYIEAATSYLPPEIRIVEQDKVSVGDYEAARWVMETTMMGSTVKQVTYMIMGDGTMYSVTFSTSMGEFNKRLPDFEKSIESFRY